MNAPIVWACAQCVQDGLTPLPDAAPGTAGEGRGVTARASFKVAGLLALGFVAGLAAAPRTVHQSEVPSALIPSATVEEPVPTAPLDLAFYVFSDRRDSCMYAEADDAAEHGGKRTRWFVRRVCGDKLLRGELHPRYSAWRRAIREGYLLQLTPSEPGSGGR